MIRLFLSFYKPHKKLFTIDFTSAVIVAILELAFPIAVQWFIDSLLPSGNWSAIISVSAALLAFYTISTLLQYVVTYYGHMLGVNIETDMREKLFNHIQKLSFRFFDNTKTGHIMSRISNDLFDIGELAHHGPEDMFIALMTIAGTFTIMVNVNATLAMITMLVIPVLVWIISFCNMRMQRAWRRMYEKIADINARVEDSVSGIRVVQAFTNERYEMDRFQENNKKFRQAKLEGYKVMAITHSSIYMATRFATLLVLVVGAWLSFRGSLTYGELVAFVLYVNVLLKPIEKISALLELYPKGMAGFKRFVELLKLEPDVQDAEDAIDVPYLRGDIRFNNVSFGYEPDRPILKNINLEIQSGETIAIVGPTGAGKTTICSLIPRFYDVTEGSITIDGIDIRKMTKRSLRSQIGIVQQDVFLFTGTLRENIAYGKLDATDEEIWDAVRRAHLEEFISGLPDGLDTQVGERGMKLSGGQKQRIAIARMFLKNPPILILDEATSALDTETERLIQQALDELAENRTTLVIAHRLATIRNADRIIVIDEHGIAEEGTREELLEKDGLFARLYEVQYQQ